MIFEAIEFAAAAHHGQFRKGTRIPYLLHPLSAARLLIDAGCADALVAAAVLHDVVEDTPVTLDDIRARFGGRVADLVEACTEPDHHDAAWEDRKSHTISFLDAATDEDVLLVAIADKIDNIRSIREDHALRGEETWIRFKRGRASQEWYYRALLDVFRCRLTQGAGARLTALLAEEVALVFDPPAGLPPHGPA